MQGSVFRSTIAVVDNLLIFLWKVYSGADSGESRWYKAEFVFSFWQTSHYPAMVKTRRFPSPHLTMKSGNAPARGNPGRVHQGQ